MNATRYMMRLVSHARDTRDYRQLHGTQEQNIQFVLIFKDVTDRTIKRIGSVEYERAFDDVKTEFLRQQRHYSMQNLANELEPFPT